MSIRKFTKRNLAMSFGLPPYVRGEQPNNEIKKAHTEGEKDNDKSERWITINGKHILINSKTGEVKGGAVHDKSGKKITHLSSDGSSSVKGKNNEDKNDSVLKQYAEDYGLELDEAKERMKNDSKLQEEYGYEAKIDNSESIKQYMEDYGVEDEKEAIDNLENDASLREEYGYKGGDGNTQESEEDKNIPEQYLLSNGDINIDKLINEIEKNSDLKDKLSVEHMFLKLFKNIKDQTDKNDISSNKDKK